MPVAAEPTTRERVLVAAAELLRRQGYAGTGLKQISIASRTPFGSLYHHFPGGKEQLGVEVLRTGGAFFLALYDAIAAEAPDLATAVERFFAGAAATLEATAYADACPIATVAGEVASTHDALRTAADQAFVSWLDALARDARSAGIGPDAAASLATQVLALLEGAFLLSRTRRSTQPMRDCSAAAVALVEAAVPRHDDPGGSR